MIKSSDLRDALADLIKVKAGLPLKVFFNVVNNCADDYCWVRLRPKRRDEGFGRIQRKIRVDFQIVLSPNDSAQVKHTDLYDIIDILDMATSNAIKITDRYITVVDTETIIFDNILTYSFVLDFTDCVESFFDKINEYDFMKELEIANLDGENFLKVED